MNDEIKYHLDFLYNICKKLKANRILEIGVNEGYSTKAFIKVCMESNAELISIDIKDCSKVIDYKDWIFIQADSTKIKLKTPIDILFIDSSHFYKQTLYELEHYSLLVTKKGVILLHDVINDGITIKKIKRAWKQLLNPYRVIRYLLTPRIGVKKAIRKFLKKHPEWNYEERLSKDDTAGLGILTR